MKLKLKMTAYENRMLYVLCEDSILETVLSQSIDVQELFNEHVGYGISLSTGLFDISYALYSGYYGSDAGFELDMNKKHLKFLSAMISSKDVYMTLMTYKNVHANVIRDMFEEHDLAYEDFDEMAYNVLMKLYLAIEKTLIKRHLKIQG